ncbi:hypothetical protein D9M72_257870 [compost metagenome]
MTTSRWPGWALYWSRNSLAPWWNWMPSCAAGPVNGADWPSTSGVSPCARAMPKPPSVAAAAVAIEKCLRFNCIVMVKSSLCPVC